MTVLVSISSPAQSGGWHPEIVKRPRLLFLKHETNNVIKSITDNSAYRSLYGDIYAAAFRSSTNQMERSQIAKAAAVVLTTNIELDNNNFSTLTSANKSELESKILEYLRTLDPTVKSPGSNYQWRAVELMQFCQTYDLFLGAGHAPDSLAEGKLADFAANAYKELSGFLVIQNNLSIKLASALGAAAITLNQYSSDDANYQPSRWIGKAMSFLNTVFWNIQSSEDRIAGYAEGPYYFRYAMISALPFFRAMKNFNGDWTESYNGVFLRSPLYDSRYLLLYEWITKIRMPDGALPAFEDTYMNSYFPELAGVEAAASYAGSYSWLNYKNGIPLSPPELSRELSGTYDFRADYIISNATLKSDVPTDWNPTTFFPHAGYTVFRNAWAVDATYFGLIGKHGRARTGESPIGSGHKQANETAFQLYAGGERLILEPGYYSYEMRDSLAFSKNHNLILVDGKGPDSTSFGNNLFGSDAFIEDTLSSPLHECLSVRTQYQGASILRKVYFLNNRYFIVVDKTSAPFARTFTHQLHGAGLLSSGTSSFAPGDHSAQWSAGNMNLYVRVDALSETRSALSQEMVTRKHAPAGRQFADHSALYSSIQGNAVTFVSVLYPYQTSGGQTLPNIESSFTDNSINYIIQSGSTIHMAIANNKKGETVELRGPTHTIASDAAFAFYAADQTHRYNYSIFADGASHFTLDGNNIFWTPANVTGMLEYSTTSIRGSVRGEDLGHIELTTEYAPSTVVGKSITRWYMSTHKLVLESSAKAADFEVELSDTPVGVAEEKNIQPMTLSLEQNYPNPFNPTTTIRFSLPIKDKIALEVFNILGQRVLILLRGEYPAGEYTAVMDAETLASGKYYYRLHTSTGTLTRSMTVLK